MDRTTSKSPFFRGKGGGGGGGGGGGARRREGGEEGGGGGALRCSVPAGGEATTGG